MLNKFEVCSHFVTEPLHIRKPITLYILKNIRSITHKLQLVSQFNLRLCHKLALKAYTKKNGVTAIFISKGLNLKMEKN